MSGASRGRNLARAVRPQEFAYWAHQMTLVAACSLAVVGVFGCVWAESGTYRCRVRDGSAISAALIVRGAVVDGTTGTCFGRAACCDPEGPSSKARNLGGSRWIGAYCVGAGLLALVLEQPSRFGYGLWMPHDSWFHRRGVSRNGLAIGALGALAFGTRATCLAGLLCCFAAVCYTYAAQRGESGDGGRARAAKLRDKLRAAPRPAPEPVSLAHRLRLLFSSDSVATTVWLMLYFGANALIFLYTLATWVSAVRDAEKDLLSDSVELSDCGRCPALEDKPYTRWRDECELNKALVRHGPLSYWAPVAKASGAALNFNCALLLSTKRSARFSFREYLGHRRRFVSTTESKKTHTHTLRGRGASLCRRGSVRERARKPALSIDRGPGRDALRQAAGDEVRDGLPEPAGLGPQEGPVALRVVPAVLPVRVRAVRAARPSTASRRRYTRFAVPFS